MLLFYTGPILPEKWKGKSMSIHYYFAGSLFCHKDVIGNHLLAESICENSEGKYLAKLPQREENQLRPSPLEIRDNDYRMLLESQLALFNFDGSDLDSGTVLKEKNSTDRIYPASLTKIMTAILAIENTEDLEEIVQLPDEIFPPLYAQNASMAGFQPGEEVRLKDLLYGVLIPSGAECCLAFADRISGSEEEFVSLMNDKAQELGMKNTHFTNSTGLHDPEHYSTVEDISILLQYALKNEYFRDVFTSSRYSTLPSEQHPEGFTFHSTMFKYMDSTEVTGGEILGGKTGYTEEAGLCLASLAQVNGKEYILVTAKANGTHQTEQFHILDAINVYSQIGEAGQNTYE